MKPGFLWNEKPAFPTPLNPPCCSLCHHIQAGKSLGLAPVLQLVSFVREVVPLMEVKRPRNHRNLGLRPGWDGPGQPPNSAPAFGADSGILWPGEPWKSPLSGGHVLGYFQNQSCPSW